MIYSMTGYAAASREFAYGVLNLEVRSVNHRYLDVQFRLPDELRSVEPQLREALAARFGRGKLDCRATFSSGAGAARTLHLNEDLMHELLAVAARVRAAAPETAGLAAGDILKWPGMLGADAVPVEELRQACRDLLSAAIEEMSASRGREGERLKAFICERIAAVERVVADVAPRIPQAVATYRERLAVRLREALGSADDERLRQEVAVFATRIDVDEELSRLATHAAEVRRVLDKGGAVGKRLDFLMQEMNREANTLGSKSADAAVSDAAIELKVLIEQMREQVQNIE